LLPRLSGSPTPSPQIARHIEVRAATGRYAKSIASLNDPHAIACVIYAAKSTEDRCGSIPGQLAECRAAIAAPGRSVVAEYTDGAFSAFRRNRGPGLREAMAHVEELAEVGLVAELWVQHSDRLARGDGQSARHTVEIALWALKRDVKIHTLQDPTTFRDLPYAVVTGERNNEDSRRKALAAQAGRKRARPARVHRPICPSCARQRSRSSPPRADYRITSSMIRLGMRVPHLRHCEALRSLVCAPVAIAQGEPRERRG